VLPRHDDKQWGKGGVCPKNAFGLHRWSVRDQAAVHTRWTSAHRPIPAK